MADTRSTALTGVILTNTGTPAAPHARAVRPYLAEFLADPRVIEYPRWLWLPLLHGVILNVRPRRSARLYQKVWTDKGSPLLHITRQQAAGVEKALAQRTTAPMRVVFGMRYGQPSIAAGLRDLRAAGARRIIVLPLFPHYSGATVGSMFDAVFDELKTWRWVPELRTINHYHDHPAYIAALADSIREHWAAHGNPDRLLFSFHGIPQSYVQDGDPYDEQCRATARLVAGALGLGADDWQASFQSRFGPDEWLQPYTDELVAEWARAGVGRVDALCPGFSADCLETADEIGREARDEFVEAGGREFYYIPALNDRPAHLAALADIIFANL